MKTIAVTKSRVAGPSGPPHNRVFVPSTTHLGLVGQVHEDVQALFHREPRVRAVDREQLLSVVRRLAAVARAQLGFGAPEQLRGHGGRQEQEQGHGHRDGGGGGRLGHRTHVTLPNTRTGLVEFRAGTHRAERVSLPAADVGRMHAR